MIPLLSNAMMSCRPIHDKKYLSVTGLVLVMVVINRQQVVIVELRSFVVESQHHWNTTRMDNMTTFQLVVFFVPNLPGMDLIKPMVGV